MNHQLTNNKIRHEQNIKNRLCLIDMEDNHHQQMNYRPFYDISKTKRKKNQELNEISDWANSYEVKPQAQKREEDTEKQETDRKRFTFFSSTRYQSSLLSQDSFKKKRLELSPIVVKFNAKVLNQNLQRSKDLFLKKLKQDPYLTHCSSFNLVFERKIKKQGSPNSKEAFFPHMNFDLFQEKTHPKTERLSGILRLMKKRQPVRMRKKRNVNPEDLVATKIS